MEGGYRQGYGACWEDAMERLYSACSNLTSLGTTAFLCVAKRPKLTPPAWFAGVAGGRPATNHAQERDFSFSLTRWAVAQVSPRRCM